MTQQKGTFGKPSRLEGLTASSFIRLGNKRKVECELLIYRSTTHYLTRRGILQPDTVKVEQAPDGVDLAQLAVHSTLQPIAPHF